MKRCGYRRVRQHRHVRSVTCGTQRQARCRRRAPRRRGEGLRGEAPWLQFTNLIDAALDLPMHEKNASPEKDGTECTNKPERWVRVDARRDQPADQGDFRRDHDPEPEPEIDELLPEAIEFGHGSLLAPSNVRVLPHRAERVAARWRCDLHPL